MGEKSTLIPKTQSQLSSDIKCLNENKLRIETIQYLKQFARAISYEPALDNQLGVFIAN